MLDKFMTMFKEYNKKWLVADFLFISDMMANGIWGQKYYAIFSEFGISSDATSAIVAFLELIRIFILLGQNHKK